MKTLKRSSTPYQWRKVYLASIISLSFISAPASFAAVNASLSPMVAMPNLPLPNCQPSIKNIVGTEVEPNIAVDPNNPLHIIIGVQQDRWRNGGAHTLTFAYSIDGGASFIGLQPAYTSCVGGTYERASDPWASFGADGSVYLSGLLFNISDLANTVSALKGTFDSSGNLNLQNVINLNDVKASVPKGEDKNSITADPFNAKFVYTTYEQITSPNQFAGAFISGAMHEMSDAVASIYGSNTNALAQQGPSMINISKDGGQTWSSARIIYNPNTDNASGFKGSGNQTLGNIITVLNDGTLMDTFTLYGQVNNPSPIPTNKWVLNNMVIFSHDHGQTWTNNGVSTSGGIYHAATVRDPDGITALSTNYGKITADDGGVLNNRDGIGLPGSNGIAVAPNGYLYSVWESNDPTAGETHASIKMSMSMDGGKTWKVLGPINEVPAKDAFTPAVAVLANGDVAVTYFDFRNHTIPCATTTDSNGDTVLVNSSCVLETDYWLALFDPMGHRIPIGSSSADLRLTDASFNYRATPYAHGYFLGDYMGLQAVGNTLYSTFVQATGTNAAPQTNAYFRKIIIQ